MKQFIILCLFPMILLGQNSTHRDTLYSISGGKLNCNLIKIDKYVNHVIYMHKSFEANIPISNLAQIYVENFGVIYSSKSGFTVSIDSLNRFFVERKRSITAEKCSQKCDSISSRRIGIGISIKNIVDSDIFDNQMAPFVLPIDFSKHVRLEPEFLYYQWSGKRATRYYTLNERKYNIGLGVFLKNKLSKVQCYYGIRIGYEETKSKRHYEYRDESETEIGFVIKRYVCPVLGSEYYINKHVSLGGEIGIRFVDMETIGESYSSYVKLLYMSTDFDEGDVIETISTVFFRYYF